MRWRTLVRALALGAGLASIGCPGVERPVQPVAGEDAGLEDAAAEDVLTEDAGTEDAVTEDAGAED